MQGFTILRSNYLTDLLAEATLLQHNETGLQVLKVANADTNKTFAIGFHTPSTNATGIQHIIEHSVLCGSRRYAVKEPFVEMVKGSLRTFINAFTFADFTAYPVASQNQRDYLNLVQVYLDAVFYPLLSQETFDRQAWHLRRAPAAKEAGEFDLSGVVFNEMKGNYSNPSSLAAEWINSELFPDTSYRYDSGGDPLEIPALTYEDFQRYHRTHYVPQNARVLLYGDGVLAEELALIDQWVSGIKGRSMSQRELQPPFSTPKILERASPGTVLVAPGAQPKIEAQSYHYLAWGLPAARDYDLSLELEIVHRILLGSSAAPLRKALNDSKLGEGVIVRGLSDELELLYLSVGLQGAQRSSAQRFEDVIFRTLATCVRDGINSDMKLAALESTEFLMRNELNGAARGLHTLFVALVPWMHAGDPISALEGLSRLARLRDKLAGTRRVEELIERFLISNQHRLRLTLYPDNDFVSKRDQQLAKISAQHAAALSPAARSALDARVQSLQRSALEPDLPEALAALPQIEIAAVEKQILRIPSEMVSPDTSEAPRHESEIIHHPIETHGIAYLQLAFSLDRVPAGLLPLVPLLARSFFETGTKHRSYEDFLIAVQRDTGGISTSALALGVRGAKVAAPYVLVHAKALSGSVQRLCDLLSEGLLESNGTVRERLLQMAREAKASIERSIISGGMSFAVQRASAHHSMIRALSEQFGGLQQLSALKEFIAELESSWETARVKCEQVRSAIVSQVGLTVDLTVSASAANTAVSAVKNLIRALPKEKSVSGAQLGLIAGRTEAFVIPSQVNYVGAAIALSPEADMFVGAFQVASNYLRFTALWNRIRIQGGAYGMDVQFQRQSRVIALGSYRDPHYARTLDQFSAALHELVAATPEGVEVRRNIIGAIATIDEPRTPESRAFEAFMYRVQKISEAERQVERDQILALSSSVLQSAGRLAQDALGSLVTVVIGGREALEGVHGANSPVIHELL